MSELTRKSRRSAAATGDVIALLLDQEGARLRALKLVSTQSPAVAGTLPYNAAKVLDYMKAHCGRGNDCPDPDFQADCTHFMCHGLWATRVRVSEPEAVCATNLAIRVNELAAAFHNADAAYTNVSRIKRLEDTRAGDYCFVVSWFGLSKDHVMLLASRADAKGANVYVHTSNRCGTRVEFDATDCVFYRIEDAKSATRVPTDNSYTRTAVYLARQGDKLADLAAAGAVPVSTVRLLNSDLADTLVGGEFVVLPEGATQRFLHAAMAKASSSSFAAQADDPLALQIALRELGQVTVPGVGSNTRIIEYLQSVDGLNPKLAGSDETDWCSCFVNWCVEQARLEGTESAVAQSWKRWGRKAKPPMPRGAIAVFQRWREGEQPSWKGHVGFALSADDDSIELLGGNQSRSVSVARYPRNGKLGSTYYRLLSLRVPK